MLNRYWCLILLVCLGCGETEQPAPSSIPDTVLEGRTFSSGALGFALSIPEDWRIVPVEELTERSAQNLELLRQKVSDLDQRAVAFEPFLLLEPAATPDSNYVTLLFSADQPDRLPNIRNGYDYFNQQALVLSGQDPTAYPRYEFSDINEEPVAGRPALSQGAMIHVDETLLQPMLAYAMDAGEYLMVVQIANFDTQAELTMAQSLLQSMRWTNQ